MEPNFGLYWGSAQTSHRQLRGGGPGPALPHTSHHVLVSWGNSIRRPALLTSLSCHVPSDRRVQQMRVSDHLRISQVCDGRPHQCNTSSTWDWKLKADNTSYFLQTTWQNYDPVSGPNVDFDKELKSVMEIQLIWKKLVESLVPSYITITLRFIYWI